MQVDRSAFSDLLLQGAPEEERAQLADELDGLAECVSSRHFVAGDYLIKEGDVGDAAYLISKGDVEILKQGKPHPVGTAGAGNLLGELALEGRGQRAASVKALTDVHAYRIRAEDYLKAIKTWPEFKRLVTHKLYQQLSDKHQDLQERHQQLLEAQKEKDSLGFLLVTLLLLLTSYALVNGFMVNLLSLPTESWLMFSFSRITELMAVVILWQLVRRSGLTAKDMGLTTVNAVASLKESLLLTLVAMLLMYGLAVYLAAYWDKPTGWNLSRFDYSYITYLLVAPLQEWVARGVFQTSLEKLLGKGKGLVAVLLSSLVFATLHLHVNPILSVVSLISGLIWGALFLRHRNLIGVSVSHFLLGNWVAFLGLWALWTG